MVAAQQLSMLEPVQNINTREIKEQLAKEAIGYTEPTKALFGMYFERHLSPSHHVNTITGKEYTNGNIWELELSMLLNGFEKSEWATFNQYASKEYKIKKGSKASKICVAVFGKSKKEGEDKENLKFFKGGSVFNIAQTETVGPDDEPTKKDVIDTTEKNISEISKTPEVQANLAEVKEITKFENKLSRNCASLAKTIEKINENLRTKKTHTRRMMHQYESKLYELNVAEFWYNLQTNLLNKGITKADIDIFEFIKGNYWRLVSIRFNSDRHYDYTEGKAYSIKNLDNKSQEKDIVNAYNWIESNLIADPAAEKAKKIDEAVRKAKNLHGVIDGFHSTPKELAEKLIQYAEIINNENILEPSAGIGGIADIIKAEIKENNLKNVQLDTCEIHCSLREILELKEHNLIGEDFLKLEPVQKYDTVIMNPPFEKGLDIDHVQHAFKFLKSGGKLISIIAGNTMHKTQKKFVDFQEFVYNNSGYTEKIESGAFKESGTMVSSEILIIKRG